jgi:DNA-binding CsgD family transcriptional regulator
VCQRHAPAIRAAVASVASPPPLTVAATRQRRYSGLPANRPGPTRAEQQAAERRARRLARYEAVVALRAQGRSRLAIAHELGLDRRTVSTWLAAGRFPERKPRASPVRSATEPFPTEIATRYAAGEDNAAAILCQYLRPYHTFTILTSASTPVP